jgi:hypothetical protein
VHYLLLLTFRPGEGPEEGTPEFEAEMRRWREINQELRDEGVVVAMSGLQPDATTTVRARDGEPVVTDGPYAETKETLFSFYVLDLPDLDAVLAWARRMPAVEYGSIEIRPMMHHEVP